MHLNAQHRIASALIESYEQGELGFVHFSQLTREVIKRLPSSVQNHHKIIERLLDYYDAKISPVPHLAKESNAQGHMEKL